MHLLRERRQDQILHLNRMVRQRVHKVEMEVAEELWVVLEDDEDHVHRGCVEASHRGCCLLAWHEVGLDEGEAGYQKVLHLVQSL